MGDTITPAIWKARKASASISAAQTIAVGEACPLPAGIDIGLAGTGGTGTIRMMLRYRLRKKKGPG
jgi:hypothetical protein